MRLTRLSFGGRSGGRNWNGAWLLGLAPLVWCTAAHAQITLTEVTRFNLDAITSGTNSDGSANTRYVGNSVNSVAWNGSRLFVAGFVNSGQGGLYDNEGIIEITNTATTGIITSSAVTYGSRFGYYPGVNSRGYTGLALSGNRLFASLDLGAAYPSNVAPGMAGYDISGTAAVQSWALGNVRGSVNVSVDPGYVVSGTSQGGSGVAWGTFGTGSTSRILNNAATGAYIYTTATTGSTAQGLQWRLPSPTMPQYARSLDFDPDTGDVYGRTGNWVTKAVRTGTNSADTPIALWNTYTGSNVVGQNIAFLSNTTNGDLVVFNERSDSSYPQTLSQAVQFLDPNGAGQSATWNFLGGASSGDVQKTGWYDFSFDPVTQTLAIAQPETYRVSIFKFGSPDPSTQLRWAADGVTLGGDGTWDTGVSQTWAGSYGPEVWNSGANAFFGGSTYPTSSVTVAAGGVSVGRGMSFVSNGYTIGGDQITLAGTSAPTNNLYVDPAVTATVNASIAAASGLSKSGAGTLVVGGTITGGNVFVNNGTLSLASTGAIQPDALRGISILATGTLDVTQIPGGYALPAATGLAGAGRVAGDVTITANSVVSPGSNVGILTITQDATVSAGGNYNWQVTSGSGVIGNAWDLLTVGGTLTIAATSADPFKVNLWSLSSTNPDVNGAISNFDSTQNYTWTIASASGGISGFSADKFLVNTSATNGTGGFSNPYGAGTFSLAQDGNNLNLVFTAGAPTVITINVTSGTQTQNEAGYPTLSGSIPVVKTGAGTLVLDQANTLSGSTTVQQGVLQLANIQAIQSSIVTPLAGGTVSLAPYQTTVVGGLDPNAGGLVDVGNGLVIVAGGLSASSMVTAIVSGFGDGSWNGSAGIVSSAAAADAGVGVPRAVGWLDNGDGTVTFAYAAPGDTNLDWAIDLLDIGTYLAGAKYDTGDPSSWSEGDYTYDGLVDITDVALYLGTGLFDTGPYNAPSGSVAAVPEPSVVAAAVSVSLAVCVARRRRSR